MVNVQNAAIASYLGWWHDAGAIDPVSDDRFDWLARPVLPAMPAPSPSQQIFDPPSMALSPRNHARPVAATPSVGHGSAELDLAASLPDTLPAFEQWLAQSDDLPGARWSRRRLLPTGPQSAPLMLIGDVPDDDDIVANTLFSGPVGVLLEAMLSAIGYQRDALRLATLALTRPPGGKIDAASAKQLSAIMMHHIHLVRPQRVIILGQDSCRILTDTDISPDSDASRTINHYGATTAALAIHHPRLLIQRPMLKRMTWNALKTLKEPD